MQTETEGVEKILHANGNEKATEVAILITDEIDIITKTAIKDKEGIT